MSPSSTLVGASPGARPFVLSAAAPQPRWLAFAAFALTAWIASPGYAIEILEIEEHWELSVGQPDTDSSGPQVTMVMSPNDTLDGEYFVFTLNHHSLPYWIAGGLQVQRWCGEEVVHSKIGPQEGTLHHGEEVISWVQRLRLVPDEEGNDLVFEIVDGESESWGNFGGSSSLRFWVSTDRVNLNDYRPAISLEESGVSFGGNRVQSLMLTKLRWTDADGNAYELNAPIDVDADLDP